MKNFHELLLNAPVQRALAEENYTTPTPIQAQTIPAALEGRDILGCAQTGTGKTAAFALPILTRLSQGLRKPRPNQPQVLVLAPTRELAIQIGDSFATYGRHLHIHQVLVYGGVSQIQQVRSLNRGTHVLVATPGRLLDLMEQGFVDLSQLEVFVLDEADRMLDMGFLPALKRIISELPEERQSLFFSATLPDSIRRLAASLLCDPVNVNVTPKSTSVERIDQQVVFVERGNKLSAMKQFIAGGDVERAIVFTKTKRGANLLADKLTKSGVRATAIHGNKSQAARQKALDAFKRRDVTVLVATDIAARGIDIDGVTHVFNYDLPVEPECYVHRIGRTGRAGAGGIAISFCSSAERSELRAIEQLIGKRIPVSQLNIDLQASSQDDREESTRRGTRRGTSSAGNRMASRSNSAASSRSHGGSATRNGESASRTRASKEVMQASSAAEGFPKPSRSSKRGGQRPMAQQPGAVARGTAARSAYSKKDQDPRPAVAMETPCALRLVDANGQTSSVAVVPKRKTLPKKHRARSR